MYAIPLEPKSELELFFLCHAKFYVRKICLTSGLHPRNIFLGSNWKQLETSTSHSRYSVHLLLFHADTNKRNYKPLDGHLWDGMVCLAARSKKYWTYFSTHRREVSTLSKPWKGIGTCSITRSMRTCKSYWLSSKACFQYLSTLPLLCSLMNEVHWIVCLEYNRHLSSQ